MRLARHQQNAPLQIVRVIVLAMLLSMVPVRPATAGLRLCNQSFDVLNVAFAVPHEDGFRSQGWWRIAPSQCATLERAPLRSRFVYIFAADVFGSEVLFGSTPLCIAPRRFDISLQENCLTRGYLDARFLEVDTGEQADWTVFVTPRPS